MIASKVAILKMYFEVLLLKPSSVAQLDARQIYDQEVAGSTPVPLVTFFREIDHEIFLCSFSPFSCQFLAKECAQTWLTA